MNERKMKEVKDGSEGKKEMKDGSEGKKEGR